MGTIGTLLLLPFMAPVWGFRFVLEQLRDEAEAVLRDEGRAFAELIDLSMRRSTGQLSEAEYVDQETELLDAEHHEEDVLAYAEQDENEEEW